MQCLAQQMDIIRGAAAAAGLGDEQSHLVRIISAVFHGLDQLTDDQKGRVAGVVMYVFLPLLHNGVVVESSSDQLHVAMRTNFLKKFVALHLNLFTQKKLLKTNL